MSIFFVFGMTRSKAAELAHKAAPKKRNNEPQGEYMVRCTEFIRTQTDSIYQAGKPVRLTDGFATPQFAADWMRLAATNDGGKHLYLRVKVFEVDADGRQITTEKGSPKTSWKELSEVK